MFSRETMATLRGIVFLAIVAPLFSFSLSRPSASVGRSNAALERPFRLSSAVHTRQTATEWLLHSTSMAVHDKARETVCVSLRAMVASENPSPQFLSGTASPPIQERFSMRGIRLAKVAFLALVIIIGGATNSLAEEDVEARGPRPQTYERQVSVYARMGRAGS